MEKILRAIINVAAELRNLSFAVTTPPMPDWFRPTPDSALPPKPEAGVHNWHRLTFEHDAAYAAYDRQRMIEWPAYWIWLQRGIASRNTINGGQAPMMNRAPIEPTPTPSDGAPVYRGGG